MWRRVRVTEAECACLQGLGAGSTSCVEVDGQLGGQPKDDDGGQVRVVAEKLGFAHIPFASYVLAFGALLSITFWDFISKEVLPSI